ncbi:P-loop NTPase fold protein [Anabaena azotica]|uniref:KAP NTPase domain-containing protein n=1 Tax=Anabaena azotica FACHB-119 TaxID=947527 RepID=A0ABR8CZW2_9NOST|nr:P-loop NTPase fold protein [Anabaena azotica]MBD2499520.1 hypothetical protein [Anabaena azotica FACHB-119]
MTEQSTITSSTVNREQIKIILKKFLDNKNYKVLAIKGKWGVGKSYIVQEFLSECKQEYYYASVFGLSSIEQLKIQILTNFNNYQESPNEKSLSQSSESIHILNKICNISSIKKNIFDFFVNKVKHIRDFILNNSETISKINLGNLKEQDITFSLSGSVIPLGLNLFFNKKISKSVICIDDLERTSNLKLDEILGFVENIAQRKECKVILIYDEDSLGENAKDVLTKYREKVIDFEAEFKPTVEENLFVVFEKDSHDIETILEVFKKTYTRNIRIIHKCKWLIDEIISLIPDCHPRLRKQIIINIIIIVLARFDINFYSGFRKISVKTISNLIDSFINSGENIKDLDDRISTISYLSYLGYNVLEIDKEIIQMVESYFYNNEEFIRKYDFINVREKQKQIIEKSSYIWEPYYNSFQDSSQEICQRLTTFIQEHHLDLTIEEFEKIENTAVDIGLNIKQDILEYKRQLLAHMIRKSPPHLLKSLRNKVDNFYDLNLELENKISQFDVNRDITGVLKKIINNYSDLSYVEPWSYEDIEFLNNCTIEEYVEWLQQGDSGLVRMVRYCLKMGDVASQRLKEAITILAKGSSLNAIRAKFLYGIDIENEEEIKDTRGND